MNVDHSLFPPLPNFLVILIKTGPISEENRVGSETKGHFWKVKAGVENFHFGRKTGY